MRIRIVVAEDSYLIREGLRLLLATQDYVDLVASVANLPELTAAVDEYLPDVVVTDVRMPPGDQDEGIRFAEGLTHSHPQIGVVVLSQHLEPEWALRLFAARASGRAYLLKERVGDAAQIRNAIESVAAGGSFLDPHVVDALVQTRTRQASSPLARLTPREREVLALIATGLSNAAIMNRLVLTERTVEKHITSLLAKFNLDPDDTRVHRRVQAVLLYLSSQNP
ncbi:response regulator transcription factor [Planotetraspora mira]|uniref:DNA-binding response regulator n=1 Tax=Planotetraspora mira TaxID=58121 RepID=A0A8J3U671_9ACTN|nr:response regulator transcription factor [Planotetraspora mira]GII33420.1 DNA-binding response regulator [Planotetraspora mira]